MKRVIRYKRAERKAFTAIEILLALAVIGVLFGLIFAFYRAAIDRSKYVEAVATVNSISNAEEVNQMNNGEYVAADNTQEVNDKLGLDIESKEYNYKVVGVTNDNFIVLAEKILDDINNGSISSEPTTIARNKSGPISPESAGEPAGGPDNTPPGETPSSPGGGGPGGGGPGGSPPGESSPEDNPPLTNGPTPDGGTPIIYPTLSAVSSDIVNLLNNAVGWGQYADTLIQNDSIKVVYADFSQFGYTNDTNGFWPATGKVDEVQDVSGQEVFVQGNTIFLNEHLSAEGYTDNAVASIIAHEATHADYSYNPQQYINALLGPPPVQVSDPFGTPLRDITATDIHIPGDSIDQEYNAFVNDVDVWNKIKGTDTNVELDFEAGYLTQPITPANEAAFKALLRSNVGYQNLPEF